MSGQPEALRLAAWLQEGAWNRMTLGDAEAAGQELRRLHEVNRALLDALQSITCATGIVAYGSALAKARAAIAKATGGAA